MLVFCVELAIMSVMDKLISLLRDVEMGVSIDGAMYGCLFGLGLVKTSYIMDEWDFIIVEDIHLTDAGMELLGILEWYEKVERGDKWV